MRGGRRVQVQFKEIEIDYKDLDSLRQFIGETGKIVPSRITGCISPVPAQFSNRSEAGTVLGLIAIHRPAQVAQNEEIL